jgi:hypothetical protein
MVDFGKFLRRAVNDNSAIFEKDDARGEQERLAKVVGDKNNGFAETARKGAEFTLKLGAGNGIQCAKGLIHQENGRVGGKGSGDADALPLAAGELVRSAIAVFCRFEADQGQEFADTGGGASGVPFLERGDERDVLGDREMGEKACVLNHIADAAAQTNGVPFAGSAATDYDLAGSGHEEAIDQFQQRSLAAAAAAQEDKGLAGSDGEADVINNRALGTTVKTVCYILELNGRAGVFCGRFRIHFD